MATWFRNSRLLSAALAVRISEGRASRSSGTILAQSQSNKTTDMPSTIARSAFRVATRATNEAAASTSSASSSALRRRALSSSFRTATPPRAKQATLAFAGVSALVVIGLSSNKVYAEPQTPPPAKRQSFGDRIKANKGGILSWPLSSVEEAEDADVEEEESAAAQQESSPSGGEASPSDGVETIAAVVAEDAASPEEEQSAYDPSTGKINWDCPCLGGMAHGPCGDEFKDAFSCFVYSEGEPKGIECVDKFKLMQDCFRKHPEVYKEELEQEQRVSDAVNLGESP